MTNKNTKTYIIEIEKGLVWVTGPIIHSQCRSIDPRLEGFQHPSDAIVYLESQLLSAEGE